MIAMSLTEIGEVVGGRVVHDSDSGMLVVGQAFVDSRISQQGGLFVALAGERVDGHDYADTAMSAGAAAVLSQRDTGHPGVLVEDPVAALGRLARHVLSRLPDLRVVALTGSHGKTSTKDLLAHVLATSQGAASTVATFGSFNNELGLPLTALRATGATEHLVLEMGARHIGDIAASCRIAPPQVSLALNVGHAHLGEFGSRAAIAEAKGEIIAALPPDGVAVLNADDPLVMSMRARTSARVITFGAGAEADVRHGEVTLDARGRPSFEVTAGGLTLAVQMRLVGRHHADNAVAAVAAALALGVPADAAVAPLASAEADSPARMQVSARPDGVTVVNDAYNANPDSMLAALDALAALGGDERARTFAVLGEMLELGDTSAAQHERVGRAVAERGIDRLVVVGAGARAVLDGARSEPAWHGDAVLAPDVDRARDLLRGELRDGDVVLFKSSRDAGLRALADRVLADEPAPAASGEGAAR